MNKTDLIARVSDVTSLNKKDSAAAVKVVIEAMADALAVGEKINLLGFGIFEVRQRAARIGMNPKTGQRVRIGACKTPVFKAAPALKKRVNS